MNKNLSKIIRNAQTSFGFGVSLVQQAKRVSAALHCFAFVSEGSQRPKAKQAYVPVTRKLKGGLSIPYHLLFRFSV